MKVVLSRKGFDSKYGGQASPILPDGRMISLPIPQDDDNFSYSDLKLDGYGTYLDLMRILFGDKIKVKEAFKELAKNTKCHLDPDIRKDVLKRHNDWRGIFGQMGTAQGHLRNQKVGKNDIFLFFGTFRKTKRSECDLIFEGDEKHALFGYLQIGEAIPVKSKADIPEKAEYHSHANMCDEENNTIYVASHSLSWKPDISGAGVFNFNDSLVLTKDGRSKSIWKLPDFFREIRISYHNNPYQEDGCFKSASRGQEFVIQESDTVEKWAKNLIERNV
jgi:hypothetical protein